MHANSVNFEQCMLCIFGCILQSQAATLYRSNEDFFYNEVVFLLLVVVIGDEISILLILEIICTCTDFGRTAQDVVTQMLMGYVHDVLVHVHASDGRDVLSLTR